MVAQSLIRIRELDAEDLQSVYRIARDSFKNPYPIKLFKHIYETHPEGFFVAEIGGDVVGYLIGFVRWENVGHVMAIAVDESHRREGVGSALMINALDRMRNNGAAKVKLEVRVSNEAAKNFYDKIGFEVRDVVPDYYSDGEAAISMVYIFD